VLLWDPPLSRRKKPLRGRNGKGGQCATKKAISDCRDGNKKEREAEGKRGLSRANGRGPFSLRRDQLVYWSERERYIVWTTAAKKKKKFRGESPGSTHGNKRGI